MGLKGFNAIEPRYCENKFLLRHFLTYPLTIMSIKDSLVIRNLPDWLALF
jgi:hypothetical protein